ncbi:MAG: tetratricopeptide repeat protein [Acidobacteriota bacterium]
MLKTIRQASFSQPPQRLFFAVIFLLCGFSGTLPSIASAATEATAPQSTGGDQVPEFDPAQATAHYHFALAKLHADAGDFEAALAAFEKSLSLDGTDVYSFLETAKFYGYLAQASRTRQQTVAYLDKSLELLSSARQLAAENPDVLRLFAETHLRLGEQRPSSYAVAQGALEKLREIEPTDLRTLISLGQIYLFSREPAKAADVLTEASRYSPRNRMVQSMLVDALMGADRRQEAEKALTDLIPLDPTNLEHSLKLANLLSERGEHVGAAQVLEQAGEGDWLTGARIRQALAREYHLIGRHQEALELVDGMLEDPFAASAPNRGLQRLKVSILSAMTRYDRAIELFRPLLEDSKDGERRLQDALLLSRLYERAADADAAVEVLRREATNLPSGVPASRLATAIAEVQKRAGQMIAAESTLRGALPPGDVELDPESVDLIRELAVLLNRDGRTAEAIGVLERGLARLDRASASAPEDDGIARLQAALQLNLAGVYGEVGEWARMGALGVELAGSTNAEIAFVGLQIQADALAEQGDLDAAFTLLDGVEGRGRQVRAKRVELLFNSERADEAKALALEAAASGEVGDRLFASRILQRHEFYPDSIELLEGLLDERSDETVLFALGAAYERVGNIDKAESTFKRLLEASPDHAPTLNYLGYTWTENGKNLEEALSMIQRAVAMDPDNGAYVDSLGWAYYRLGRYEAARPHLEWAGRLTPDDPTVHEHLGDLYTALGDEALARAAYRRSLEILGEDSEGATEDQTRIRGKLEAFDAAPLTGGGPAGGDE